MTYNTSHQGNDFIEIPKSKQRFKMYNIGNRQFIWTRPTILVTKFGSSLKTQRTDTMTDACYSKICRNAIMYTRSRYVCVCVYIYNI